VFANHESSTRKVAIVLAIVLLVVGAGLVLSSGGSGLSNWIGLAGILAGVLLVKLLREGAQQRFIPGGPKHRPWVTVTAILAILTVCCFVAMIIGGALGFHSQLLVYAGAVLALALLGSLAMLIFRR